MVAHRPLFFPNLRLVTLQWWLKTSHSGHILTMESGLCFSARRYGASHCRRTCCCAPTNTPRRQPCSLDEVWCLPSSRGTLAGFPRREQALYPSVPWPQPHCRLPDSERNALLGTNFPSQKEEFFLSSVKTPVSPMLGPNKDQTLANSLSESHRTAHTNLHVIVLKSLFFKERDQSRVPM